MMKCLVTGGAGFIGSHLATLLVERGDSVRVFDNFSTGKCENLSHLGDNVEVIQGDLLDEAQVERAVRSVEVVFHQAALASVPRSVASPLDTHAACVTGTLNLLTASKDAGVRRFIYAGSSSAYGNQPFGSKREVDLPAPLSPYAAAKLAGELYCKAFYATYGMEAVVIRYFNVFGPRQDPNSQYSAVIPRFVTAMLRGESPVIYGDGLQSRDFTYVENVVHANLAAAEARGAAGGVFNAACGESVTLVDLVSNINRLIGSDIKPRFDAVRVGDVRSSLADISSAQRVLNYAPVVDFSEGLRRSIEYYAKNGS
ncbi:MAG: SDR family oxidoreductase [Planctomycetales bacterium]|nr:SDR family oxidoreductase [Planctomycetales bacterium]